MQQHACSKGEWLELPFGVRPGARRATVHSGTVPHATLQAAAVGCVAEAVLAPADPAGEAAAEFTAWVEAASAQLRL